MAYRMYTTEGIILSHFDVGEANRFYLIHTKDLGLIGATAQGVRYTKSKLAFGLQKFSLVSVSVVRGKEVWRITTSSPQSSYVSDIEDGDRQRKQALVKMTQFVLSIVGGEEKDVRVYSLIKSGIESLISISDKSLIDLHQLIFKSRLLHLLGYAREREDIKHLITTDVWDKDVFSDAQKTKKTLLSEVAYSLNHIHI